MESELTRLATHVRLERDRAPQRDTLRNGLLQQLRRDGWVMVTRHVLEDAFPVPDQTENFFLAVGGCRPIPPLMSQVEQWCAVNDLELRYHPAEVRAQTIVSNPLTRTAPRALGAPESCPAKTRLLQREPLAVLDFFVGSQSIRNYRDGAA